MINAIADRNSPKTIAATVPNGDGITMPAVNAIARLVLTGVRVVAARSFEIGAASYAAPSVILNAARNVVMTDASNNVRSDAPNAVMIAVSNSARSVGAMS